MKRGALGWRRLHRLPAIVVLLSSLALFGNAYAQSKNLAPGFTALPKDTTVAIMPTDIELFAISAGGVLEPRADWTESAAKNFKVALVNKEKSLGLGTTELSESDADDLAEINYLHAAVARSISMHHFGSGSLRLPTKNGKLDWSLGQSVRAIKEKTGADYALFSWVRDSYASGERVAAMVMFALLGVGVHGGVQVGYASLVDLNSGRVLWFNQLVRGTGDLREPEKAAETLNALLDNFPATK